MTRWLRPSLTDLLGVFLVACVLLVGHHRLFGDSDAALHTATGYWIVENGEIPRVDPFSTTHEGEWFAFQWLADIGFAWLHSVAGWSGLLLLSVLLIGAAHVLLYRFLVRRGANPLVSFLAVLAAAVTSSAHWLARPLLWTSLCLALMTICLEEVLCGRRARAWLAALPPLVLLWANLHGGFLVGIAVVACYALGTLLQARPWDRGVGPGSRAERSRTFLVPLGLTFAGCVAASLINPWGWRLPLHLATFAAGQQSGRASIAEWAPAGLDDRSGLILLVFLLACAAALVFRLLAADAPEASAAGQARPCPFHPGAALAFVLTAAMALLSIRHVKVVAVFGALVLADGVSHAWRRRSSPTAGAEWDQLGRAEARTGGALFLASLLALGVYLGVAQPKWIGYDRDRFPAGMVRRMRDGVITPRGPVFAPSEWGGFVILEWPRARVFVDGRWDMYGRAFMDRFLDIWAARPGWADALEQADVHWALLPPDAPLQQPLRAHPDWKLWGEDATATVFRRRPRRGG